MKRLYAILTSFSSISTFFVGLHFLYLWIWQGMEGCGCVSNEVAYIVFFAKEGHLSDRFFKGDAILTLLNVVGISASILLRNYSFFINSRTVFFGYHNLVPGILICCWSNFVFFESTHMPSYIHSYCMLLVARNLVNGFFLCFTVV